MELMDSYVPAPIAAHGVTYRQLNWWVRQGYLRPANPHPGSGTRRVWSTKELRVGARMAALVAAGLLPRFAAEAARVGSDIRLTDHVRLVVELPDDAPPAQPETDGTP